MWACRALKSRFWLPHMSFSSSSGLNSFRAGPPHNCSQDIQCAWKIGLVNIWLHKVSRFWLPQMSFFNSSGLNSSRASALLCCRQDTRCPSRNLCLQHACARLAVLGSTQDQLRGHPHTAKRHSVELYVLCLQTTPGCVPEAAADKLLCPSIGLQP